MFKDCDDCECGEYDDNHFLMQYDASRQIKFEDDAKMVQAFYKQLGLQNRIQKDSSLDPTFKKDVMYTNKSLLGDMQKTIERNNIDLPSSYMQLSIDANTNTILNALQNRSVHIQQNPYGRQ